MLLKDMLGLSDTSSNEEEFDIYVRLTESYSYAFMASSSKDDDLTKTFLHTRKKELEKKKNEIGKQPPNSKIVDLDDIFYKALSSLNKDSSIQGCQEAITLLTSVNNRCSDSYMSKVLIDIISEQFEET